MLKSLFLASSFCVLVGTSWAQTPPAPSPAPSFVVGQPAPALSVRDANGKTHTLNELRGKKSLLITFFPRCFTGNCTSQLTSLRDAYPQLQQAGVEVWAVSTDGAQGPHGQRAFAKYLCLPFPLIPDADRKLCLLFGAVKVKEQMAARMSAFIDKGGQVKWIDKQISPRTHGQDVLARVKAMQAVYVPSAASRWLDISLEATAREVERHGPRPTVVSRTLAVALTAMYDAWATYDDRALGTRLGASLRRPAGEGTQSNKEVAIVCATLQPLCLVKEDGGTRFCWAAVGDF